MKRKLVVLAMLGAMALGARAGDLIYNQYMSCYGYWQSYGPGWMFVCITIYEYHEVPWNKQAESV